MLIGTHGVGPALAMAILATHPPAALVDIVAGGDVAALTLVPGRRQEDRRAAARRAEDRLVGAGARPGRRRAGGGGSAVGDVREALAGLGYGTEEIRDALRELPADADAATLLRDALQAAGGPPCVTSSSTRASTGDAEDVVEAGLRPRLLAEFVGQRELKEHLAIVLEAARRRGQAVDHLLFAGPPGLGKTTLAGIVAAEMGVHLHITSGPALERAGDLAAILTKLDERRRAVHRRDPPPVAGRRGDPVPGDGGLPARHRRRQGPGGVEHPPDAAAVHARRRHHPHRA